MPAHLASPVVDDARLAGVPRHDRAQRRCQRASHGIALQPSGWMPDRRRFRAADVANCSRIKEVRFLDVTLMALPSVPPAANSSVRNTYTDIGHTTITGRDLRRSWPMH